MVLFGILLKSRSLKIGSPEQGDRNNDSPQCQPVDGENAEALSFQVFKQEFDAEDAHDR